MTSVQFYEQADDRKLRFAVIAAKTDGHWIFCRHRERSTLEMPGGHREPGEDILTAAKRELYEETGAVDFDIEPVCVYSVTAPQQFDGQETFGMLFYADVRAFEKELHSEIERIEIRDDLPEAWTYPDIQPLLFREVLRRKGGGSPAVAVNGVTLHYAVAGEGRPVVLLHGNGEDHTIFRVETEQLTAAGYRVFAPDSRGHGANEPLPEYHYADMAEDIYEFIRAMGLRKPALYGFSDGGIIGLMLELRHPGTLGALAVSGTNLSPEGVIPSFREEWAAANEAHPDPLVTLMLTEPRIDPESLKGIRIPVLVTAGEHDLILRSETEKIAAAIPGAAMVIVDHEDHGSYVAGSDIMGKLLIGFLKEKYR